MSFNVTTHHLMSHTIELIQAGPRLPFIIELLKGKKVLHVGCTDYPIFNPQKNLHITLAKEIEYLHGLDIDKAGIEEMAKYVSKHLFSDYSQLTETYDIVLVPEVMEHTLNPGLFLKELMGIKTRDIVVLVPNMIETVKQNIDKYGWVSSSVYAECVHDDHTCFFSPKTLACMVERSIDAYYPKQWMLGPMFIADLSIGCIIRKVANPA